MKIEHVALWVKDLEKMKAFYEQHLGFIAGEKYENPDNQFQSYFLSTPETGSARLELMHRPAMADSDIGRNQVIGMSHIAFTLGSREKVDACTEAMLQHGCEQLRPPRITGDGYYESLLLDPEGNRIELAA